MQTSIVKRSIELHGHKTSVSLEDEFWKGLHDIAASTGTSLSEIIRTIDAERGAANLSSAIRVFVFNHYRSQRPKQQTEDKMDGTAPRAPHDSGNQLEL